MTAENTRKPHSICVYNRERAEITGISEVESFHDTEILLSCPHGDISVEGENLKIDSFSVESGKIIILGAVSAVAYFDRVQALRKGLFARKAR